MGRIRRFVQRHVYVFHSIDTFVKFIERLGEDAAKEKYDSTLHIESMYIYIDRLFIIDRIIIRWYMQKYHQKDAWIFDAWRLHRRSQNA